MGILITFFLGFFIIAGALIARFVKDDDAIQQLSISIALGAMATLAATELVPESVENIGKDNIPVAVIAVFCGIGILKLLDKFIPNHDNIHTHHHQSTPENVIHIGIISSIAVILHNIIEGMAVYSVSAESPKTAVLLALGVGLHNIPMGMVIYSTLKHERRTVKTALLLLTALSTLAGGILMSMMWTLINSFVTGVLISLTLGMIIYITAFELAPHILHSQTKRLSLLGIAIGISVILLGMFFE